MEDKKSFVENYLAKTVMEVDNNIVGLEYINEKYSEIVRINYATGLYKDVNVNYDSNLGILKDVIGRLEY